MRRKDLEFRDLRNFLAVANTLHFSRAAAELGIAQPVLSKQIQQLEVRLGGPLFVRTSRGVKLTHSGEYFRRRAEAILVSVRDSVKTTRRLGRGQEGTLAVGLCDSVMFTNFHDIVKQFRNTYPKVDLSLREMSKKRQIELLLNGTLDVGFARYGQPVEGLIVQRIHAEPYRVILPQSHPLGRRSKLNPSDLRDERIIVFASARSRYLQVLHEGSNRPKLYQETSQWSSVLSLVRSGMGVSVAPASIESLPVLGLAYRPLNCSQVSSIDVMYCPEMTNPVLELFLAMAKEGFTADTV